MKQLYVFALIVHCGGERRADCRTRSESSSLFILIQPVLAGEASLLALCHITVELRCWPLDWALIIC
eukprot:1019689-Pyramimonas_sp.AAC.1